MKNIKETIEVGKDIAHLLKSMYWKGQYKHPEKEKLINGFSDILKILLLVEDATWKLPDIAKIMEGENLFGGKRKELVADKIKAKIAPILVKTFLNKDELKTKILEMGYEQIAQDKRIDDLLLLQKKFGDYNTEELGLIRQANKAANKVIEEEVNLKTKALLRVEEQDERIKELEEDIVFKLKLLKSTNDGALHFQQQLQSIKSKLTVENVEKLIWREIKEAKRNIIWFDQKRLAQAFIKEFGGGK